MDYKINNKIYESTYDFTFMDEVIKYELNTTKHLINNDINNNLHIELGFFLNKILYKDISYLFYFLYTIDTIVINKFRLKLQNYFKTIIPGVSKYNNKIIFINKLCKIIYKKLSVIEFTSFFTENDFMKNYNKFKRLNI